MNAKRLPDAELAVMQIIWEASGPVTSAYVLERVQEPYGWKATSVLTFLTRLCEKGFLACAKEGKHNIYTPLVAAADYRQKESIRFLQKMYRGSLRDLVASLSDAGAVTGEDLAQLRAFLAQQKEE